MLTEIFAEIGQNHNGDLELAKELILQAKKNGADVAKFQVYNAKKLFPPRDVNEWFDYNCKTELSKQDVSILKDFCDKNKIEFMASVFDLERIEWLEDLGVLRYKVASRSIYDNELLDALSSLNKPLILSLGMWKEKEFPKINSKAKVEFLYCISKYPTKLSEVNLINVDFSKYSGFSDHTEGVTSSIFAITKGARIIEKHLTLDKAMYGPDHSCSMNPEELKIISNFAKDCQFLT